MVLRLIRNLRAKMNARSFNRPKAISGLATTNLPIYLTPETIRFNRPKAISGLATCSCSP